MSVEYQAYQEDGERKVKLLTADVAMQHEQHKTQVEQLKAKYSKLEYKLTGELELL